MLSFFWCFTHIKYMSVMISHRMRWNWEESFASATLQTAGCGLGNVTAAHIDRVASSKRGDISSAGEKSLGSEFPSRFSKVPQVLGFTWAPVRATLSFINAVTSGWRQRRLQREPQARLMAAIPPLAALITLALHLSYSYFFGHCVATRLTREGSKEKKMSRSIRGEVMKRLSTTLCLCSFAQDWDTY